MIIQSSTVLLPAGTALVCVPLTGQTVQTGVGTLSGRIVELSSGPSGSEQVRVLDAVFKGAGYAPQAPEGSVGFAGAGHYAFFDYAPPPEGEPPAPSTATAQIATL